MAEQNNQISIRPYRDEDAEALAKGLGNYEVAKHTGAVPYPYTVEVAEGWICINDWAIRRGLRFNWAVVDATDQLVGGVGVFPSRLSDDDTARWEIGYWIGEPFWGRGFATQAVELAMRFIRDTLHEKNFDAAHYIDNPASGRVLEKTGFAPTGEVREGYSLARTSSSPMRVMQRDGSALDVMETEEARAIASIKSDA